MTATTTNRFDLAVTLPTGFRWGGTYSLVLEDDALYVIRLSGVSGKGPQVDADAFLDHNSTAGDKISAHLGVAMAQPAIKMMEKKFGAKRDASVGLEASLGLERLEAQGARAMADEKGSYRFERGDLKSLKAGRKGNIETLTLKTKARSFPFRLGSRTGAPLKAFLEDVRSWAGI
ncbi:hypothetical protein [Rubrivirga sp.]|uniref:hypothetical protein n=1 Tax=Rubrivirga sp. TaxID=1885344 RepID=UPI003C715A48